MKTLRLFDLFSLAAAFLFVILTFGQLSLTSGQRTNFINHTSKVQQYDEPQWFLDSIPFIELPHQEIEDVYYYRWSSLKRHLRYATPGAGYIITEFIHHVFWAGKFDTIDAAAGHHINEARWLRNQRYVTDYINFWSRIGGEPNKYSEWIADTTYKTFLVNGDLEFVKGQLKGLVRNYKGWDGNFEPTWGLYWISPEWDAQENSCASMQTDDPYHGGIGYRPSFNAEMYGNAVAISKIAELSGDLETAREFQDRADALQQALLRYLWDPERKFFYHAFRDNNVNYALLDSREEVGFYPWQWKVVPNDTEYTEAWKQLFDPEGFNVAYGPATCEVRSQWYDGDQVSQCCYWNGNSWPYSTSLTLASLAAQIRDYANSAWVTANEYFELLEKYAITQYKNDKPYVAECHSPVNKHWVCDNRNGSEHYAHSTYTDNVLSELIGVQPSPSDIFAIHPLVPNNWKFFALENLLYHGHEITVLWDADGSYYESGHSGLQIFVNGVFTKSQPNIGPMSVSIPAPKLPEAPGKKRVENYAANVNSAGYPEARTSFLSGFASEWHPLDGRIFYDSIPTNRWTNWGSTNGPTDWYSVNFGPGRAKNISQVKLYIYSDVVTGEGGVDCPKKMVVEIFNGSDWTPVANQKNTPSVCSPNDVNTIDFSPVKTEQVRVVFTRDVENNYFVGMTELEIWAPWPQAPEYTYEFEDGLIINAQITASPLASGGSFVGQIEGEDSSAEILGAWVDRAGNYFIKVFYAAHDQNGESSHNLLVNNEDEFEVTYFPTSGSPGSFANSVTIQAPLQRGNNALLFRKGQGVVQLDRIQILV